MVKRECDLLKSELSEKTSCLMRQGIFIAVGGLVALTGAELLLVGICGFIAYGLKQAGLSPLMSAAIAFLTFGAILGGIGYAVLKKGIAALSKTSLAPDQTLKTVKEMTQPAGNPITARANIAANDSDSEKARKVSAARSAAERKIEQVQREAAEIRARLTPRYMWAATCTAVNRRPRMSAGIGASMLAVVYMFIRRRRAHAKVVWS